MWPALPTGRKQRRKLLKKPESSASKEAVGAAERLCGPIVALRFMFRRIPVSMDGEEVGETVEQRLRERRTEPVKRVIFTALAEFQPAKMLMRINI